MLAIERAANRWEPEIVVPDEELLQRYRAGEVGGFNELMERYRRPLFSVIWRMVHDRNEAEDIFQETFFRVLKHHQRFDAERKFSTWLYTIATNLCRDFQRRQGRSPMTSCDAVPEAETECSSESEVFSNEVSAKLERALERLSPEQREVFLLREQAGLSFKEIAAVTHGNLNTVLGRMHLALKKLREELSDLREVVS
jgi:RNA polymerase sigma-70 factor, ECF subfamily